MVQDETLPLGELYFYLTHGCNMQCAHCWLSKEIATARDQELGADEIKNVIDQALDLGLAAVKLTGGEPFLHPGLLEIMQYADARGLSLRIETNGTLVGPAEARALGAVRGLRHVGVSVDGASAESHAFLRQVPASFDKALRAIRLLRENDVAVEMIACIHRHNAHEIDSLVALAADVGAYRLKLNPIAEVGRGGDLADRGELLSIEELLAFAFHLETDIVPESPVSIHLTLPIAFHSLSTIRREGVGRCGILNILGILPDGKVSLCGIGEQQPELVFGDVKRESLQEIWQNSANLKRARDEIGRWPTGVCRQCLVRRYCSLGYCRAGAYEVYGSLAAAYPLCQQAFDQGSFPPSRLAQSPPDGAPI